MNRIIGHYEIRELLGSGGIGQVYAGVDLELGRNIAIKVLRPEFSSDPGFVERFRAEAASLARLNHPNITTLYSLHRQDQELFMIMELVHGQTLEALLTRVRRLGGRESLAMVAQTAAGLSYAHRMGVIHRDIKPANLMVTDSGLLKIMDFGIARVRGSQRLTREGSIVGTLAYVAPEQVKGAEGDERSDLYSLACVLYEMLSGEPPFRSDSDYEMLRAQVEQRPEPLAVRPQGLDAKVEQALMQGLAKDPEQRYASVADFSRALGAAAIQVDAEDILRDGLVSPQTPPPATRVVEVRSAPGIAALPKPAVRSRRPLVLAAGGVIAAAILGFGFLGHSFFMTPVVAPSQQSVLTTPAVPAPLSSPSAPSPVPQVTAAQPAPSPAPQSAPQPPAPGPAQQPASTQPAAGPPPQPAPPVVTAQPETSPVTDTAAPPQQAGPRLPAEATAIPPATESPRPPGAADAAVSTDLGKGVVLPQAIKGMVTSVTPDGWPVIDGQSVRLAGIQTIDTDKVARIAVWIEQHGSYLSCEPQMPGYRCLTQQNIDVAQAVLLNGAGRASADASPIYRAAEDQARAAHRGVWQ
jgi:serine/threonine-protein kinase